MKKLASAVFVVIGATALMLAPACGGDDEEDPTIDTTTTTGDGDGDTTGDGDGDGDTACNLFTQVGCEEGEKCAFITVDIETDTGFVGCIADGTVPAGMGCDNAMANNTSDNCQAGLACVFGTCAPHCSAGNDCDSSICVGFIDRPDEYQICLSSCDPLAPPDAGECPGTLGCYLSTTSATGGACAGAGNVEVGESCQALNECAPGAACIGPAGAGVCEDLCGPWENGIITEGTPPDDVLVNFDITSCGQDAGCANLTDVCAGLLGITEPEGDGILDRIAFCRPDAEIGEVFFDPPLECSCQNPQGDNTICVEPATLAPKEPVMSTPPRRPMEHFRL